MEGLQIITFYLRNNSNAFRCNSSFIFGSMSPRFNDDCSSEIVQQTIDYGLAVPSSFSKRSSPYQNIVSYSIGHNSPSLATNRSICCQTYLVKTPDDVSINLEIPFGEREVPFHNPEVCSHNPEVCSYNPEVPSYHPEVPPCARDVCSGDHKCDIDPGPIDNTSGEIDTNFSSKMQIKSQKKRRLGRIRQSLKLSCFRHWNIVKRLPFRRLRPTPVKSEITCVPGCNIPKPILKEFGTGMKFNPPKTAAVVTSNWLKNLNSKVLRDVALATSGFSVSKKSTPILVSALTSNKGTGMKVSPPKTAAVVTSKWLKNLNSKVLRDVAGATSGFSVSKKSTPILVSAFTSNEDMLKKMSTAKIFLQTGTQISKCPFANHKGLMAKKKTVSFNGGSCDVTKLSSTNHMLKQGCSVMTETLGSGSIRPPLLSRSAESRNSTSNLPVKFCPSKWADVVVNRIIQHVLLKHQKQLKTKSCGTWTTPVKRISFSTQPRSFHSSVNLNHQSSKLMSTKSSQGHHNIVNDLGTQNSLADLPFSSSDLAEKVAKKIIQHMPIKLKSLVKFHTQQERGINVDTDCNATLPPKQEIMSVYHAKPSENTQPSSDSSKPDSSSTLKSKQGHNVFAHAILSCIRAQSPSSQSINMNPGQCDPDPEPKPENQSPCSTPPRGCAAKDCKTSRDGIVLNTGTDPECDEEFGNKVEQLATQIAAEVDELKTLALKAYPMIHETPTCCHKIVQCLESQISTRFSKTKADLDDALTQTDCNDTGEKTTPTPKCAVLEAEHDAQFRHNFCYIGVNASKLCGSKSEMGDSNTCFRTKEIQVPLSKSGSTQFIEAVSDDSDCDFSIVQYICNLLNKKMAQVKCRFNQREEPLQAFSACQALFRAMQVYVRESSSEQRRDIQSQTSIIEQVPALTSTEVQKAIETPPNEAKAYRRRCRPEAVWNSKICTIHRGRRYESGESRTEWCVRMRQSCLVNHASSVTNICSGHETEDLRGVYYMLSAMEGRIRRVKCGNRIS